MQTVLSSKQLHCNVHCEEFFGIQMTGIHCACVTQTARYFASSVHHNSLYFCIYHELWPALGEQNTNNPIILKVLRCIFEKYVFAFSSIILHLFFSTLENNLFFSTEVQNSSCFGHFVYFTLIQYSHQTKQIFPKFKFRSLIILYKLVWIQLNFKCNIKVKCNFVNEVVCFL